MEQRPGPYDAGSRTEVRQYYRTVGAFLEMELSDRGDRDYWENLVREMQRPRVLELGAGTGRVTRMVAPLAREVVAVDLSRWMLDRAREVLEGMGGVHLIQADMRRLPVRGHFDLVIAANDPLVHLSRGEERDQVLRLVSDHLRPGGVFILDSFWLRPSTRRKAAGPGGWKRSRSIGPPDREVVVREEWTLEPDTWIGRVSYEYEEEGRNVARASFRPRLWSPDEVRERFSRAGLTIRRVFGDYQGTPWDPDVASCLLVEAAKEPEETPEPTDPAPREGR